MALLQLPNSQAREGSHSSLKDVTFEAPRFRQINGRIPKGPFVFRGQRYCSRSEAACGALLEKYIEGFRVRERSTYQVPIVADNHGNLKSVDFLVAGVLLEFHPPRLWRSSSKCGDFNNCREYLDFRKTHDALPEEEKSRFRLETKDTLANNYYRKRRKTVDENPILRKLELVVATSASELYDRIIDRFSTNKPSKEVFLAEFAFILEEVRDTRPIHCRPRRFRNAA